MRNFTRLLLLIALTACSRPAGQSEGLTTTVSTAPAKTTDVSTVGTPYDLRLDGAAVSFCDSRGARKIDLASGSESASALTCTRDAGGNTACDGLPFSVEVRTPDLGPNDVIDTAGQTYPLDGRVQDCAASGQILGVVTGSTVVLIDTNSDKLKVIDHAGGNRVAISADWIAWSDNSSVHVRKH
jgi:hypothetical protein